MTDRWIGTRILDSSPRWLVLPVTAGLACLMAAGLDTALEIMSRNLWIGDLAEGLRFVVALLGTSFAMGFLAGALLAAIDRALRALVAGRNAAQGGLAYTEALDRARMAGAFALTLVLLLAFVRESWHRPLTSSPLGRIAVVGLAVACASLVATLGFGPASLRHGRRMVAGVSGSLAIAASHYGAIRIEATFRLTFLAVGAALLTIAWSDLGERWARADRAVAGILGGLLAIHWLGQPRDRRILSAHTLWARDLLSVASGARFFAEATSQAAPWVDEDAPKGPRPPATAVGSGVVILTVDALRADRLGAYGGARRLTPHIDRFLERSVVFDRAYAQYPSTMVSIPTLLSGRFLTYPARNWRVFWRETPTLQNLLGRADYRSAVFSPLWIGKDDSGRMSRLEAAELGFSGGKIASLDAHDRAQEVISELRKGSRPLIWAHFAEPHSPYVVHPGFEFGTSEEEQYASEVAYVDDALRPLFEYLDTRPDLVVWFTSDHGEALGEHGDHFHTSSVYDEQTRVPLALRAPGLAPRRVGGVAQLMDIVPTTLALLGVPGPSVDGRDLRTGIAAGVGARYGFAVLAQRVMVASATHKLICDAGTAGCELYDLMADPSEKHDLANRGFPEEGLLLSRLLAFVQGEAVEPGAPLRSLRDALARRRALEKVGEQTVAIALGDDLGRLGAARAIARRGRLLGDEASELRAAEADPSPLVRTWSLVALARGGDAEGQRAVRRIDRRAVAPPDLAQWVVLAQYESGAEDTLEDVRSALRGDHDSDLVYAAIDAVRSRRDTRLVGQLEALSSDATFAVAAARALLRVDPERLLALLPDLLGKYRSDDVSEVLVRMAGIFPENAAIESALQRLLDAPTGPFVTSETALSLARLNKPLRPWVSAATFGPPGPAPTPYRMTLHLAAAHRADWHLYVAIERANEDDASLDVRVNGHSLGTLEAVMERSQDFDVPAAFVHEGDNDVELVGQGQPPILVGVAFLKQAEGD
jgi:hypothetical protein